jgi:hypothetical protein
MKVTGENRSTWGKTCPSATLSITNPTWTDQGSNQDVRGERPATNRLSHGRVMVWNLINPLNTKRICFIERLSAYRAVNTLHFGYKNQSLNVL